MIAADSNVVIAAVSKWHSFHIPAVAAINRAIAKRELLLPQRVILESYSVLTRMPLPHQLRPDATFALLYETFGSVPIVSLTPERTWQFLRDRAEPTAGKRLYDAAIAIVAIEGGARQLLTFNPRDFQAFADRIEIVTPS